MVKDIMVNEILRLQKVALDSNNPPFSAVVVKDGTLLSSAFNDSRSTGNPLRHAEMRAVQLAIETHGASILKGAQLFASNEPCPMCVGACIWSGIEKVVYFLSQQQIKDIRGWGRFVTAKDIAGEDDSDIVIEGPINNAEMLLLHRQFWESNDNNKYRHSIHLAESNP